MKENEDKFTIIIIYQQHGMFSVLMSYVGSKREQWKDTFLWTQCGLINSMSTKTYSR